MTIYFYKENYQEPEPPVKYELTEQEKEDIKTFIKDYVNNIDPNGKMILKEAIDLVQADLLLSNKHVSDNIIKKIVLDARAENGYPNQKRYDISSFVNLENGFIEITAIGHGFSDGQYVQIIKSNNYKGKYYISNVDIDTFHIESEWFGDDATGTVFEKSFK